MKNGNINNTVEMFTVKTTISKREYKFDEPYSRWTQHGKISLNLNKGWRKANQANDICGIILYDIACVIRGPERSKERIRQKKYLIETAGILKNKEWYQTVELRNSAKLM